MLSKRKSPFTFCTWTIKTRLQWFYSIFKTSFITMVFVGKSWFGVYLYIPQRYYIKRLTVIYTLNKYSCSWIWSKHAKHSKDIKIYFQLNNTTWICYTVFSVYVPKGNSLISFRVKRKSRYACIHDLLRYFANCIIFFFISNRKIADEFNSFVN